jgi:hypothetical protein
VYIAASKGHLDVVNALLAAGADPSTATMWSTLYLLQAPDHPKTVRDYVLLFMSAATYLHRVIGMMEVLSKRHDSGTCVLGRCRPLVQCQRLHSG